MTRLRRDDNAGPAAGHHLAELLEYDGRAVEIHTKDRFRRRLTGGDTSCMDEPHDLANARCLADQRTHGLARGYIEGRDADLVASVGHDLCCRVRVQLTAISEHDVLSYSDPPRDRLTDLAGSDDDNDVLHGCTSVIS